MNKKLVIIGAGGHGKVCAAIAEDMQKWDEIVFLDDYKERSVLNYKIIGKVNIDNLDDFKSDYFVGLGDNLLRETILKKLKHLSFKVVNLVHPNALLRGEPLVGYGTLIMPKVYINISAKIGNGVIVNTGSIVEHDCQIEDFSHLAPNCTIAGNVKIGKKCFIGISTTILNNLSISDEIQVGAFSLVTRDLKKAGIYYGIPAKKKKNIVNK